MTTRMLFGAEPKAIKFKVIKPVFETLIVKDTISSYFSNTRYTDPQQVFDAFMWLQREESISKKRFNRIKIHFNVFCCKFRAIVRNC